MAGLISSNFFANLIIIISIILILIPPLIYIKNKKQIKSTPANMEFNADLCYINALYNKKLIKNRNIITPYGLVIEITRLISENYISVDIDESTSNPKEKITLKINHAKTKKLNSKDKSAINILRLFDKDEINLKTMDEELNRKTMIKKFRQKYRDWFLKVERKNTFSNPYHSSKYRNSLVFLMIILIVYLVISVIPLANMKAPLTYYLIQIITLIAYIYYLDKFDKIFGQYTEKGYKFLNGLNALKEYLSSYDLIRSNPPKNWEKYLLYSVCFEVYDDFYKNMNQLRDYQKEDVHLFIENEGISLLNEIFKKAKINEYTFRKDLEKEPENDVNVAELLPPVYLT